VLPVDRGGVRTSRSCRTPSSVPIADHWAARVHDAARALSARRTAGDGVVRRGGTARSRCAIVASPGRAISAGCPMGGPAGMATANRVPKKMSSLRQTAFGQLGCPRVCVVQDVVSSGGSRGPGLRADVEAATSSGSRIVDVDQEAETAGQPGGDSDRAIAVVCRLSQKRCPTCVGGRRGWYVSSSSTVR